MRVRFIILAARIAGTSAVAELVKSLEGDEEALYEGQGVSPEVAAIAADEREHAVIWDRLKAGEQIPRSARPAATAWPSPGPPRAPRTSAVARRGTAPADASGTLRAVIFGVSDGLVSNLSLVMGVAGAASDNPSFILLAGIAGLLAGAFSMAAGEYISMQSQRELFERQIELERAEMEAMPEEEEAELAASYRAKGFAPDEAARIAHRIFRDPETALDMLVREELGLDPDELGSPWGAATGSFVAFAIGAVIPVIPYLFGGGQAVLFVSLGLSLVALFAVGAAVSLLTGRGHDLLGRPPDAHRPGGGARDVRHRFDHRRRGGLRRHRRWPPTSMRGCAPRASTRVAGRTVRAIAMPSTTTATTRSSSSNAGRSASASATGRRSTSPPATGSSCRPAPPTTRSSGRLASPVSRRIARPVRSRPWHAGRPGHGESRRSVAGVGYRPAGGKPMGPRWRIP